MSTGTTQGEQRSLEELEEDLAATMTVQEGTRCLTVTIPTVAAEGLDIEGGDTLLFWGEEGDQSLEIRKFTSELFPE